MHHTYKNTIAFACFYTHWAEWLIANLTPGFVTLYVFQDKLHMFTFMNFIALAASRAHYYHSGFEFPYNAFEIPIFTGDLISWFSFS